MASYQDRELAKLKSLKGDKGFFGKFVKKLARANCDDSNGILGDGVLGDGESKINLVVEVNGVVDRNWGLGLLCERLQGLGLDNLETVFSEVKGLSFKPDN